MINQTVAEDRHMAPVFFALGDGTRLALVQRLVGQGAQTASRLSENAQVTRQAIIKHLQVLEGAGLVQHQRHGREVFYTLKPQRLAEAQAFLYGISAGWDRAIERLRHIVEPDQPNTDS
ncbi:ArsR/SmtB family transcription factor [Advenella mimigardefordensis]|uniref:Transcriptional regulator, ArsR family n=1 Tax=Advenella mimigardefordensis (strain DSM 17166 / LMG 22922 / DPN7) TaxID=1247726 RepID=W0PKA5_ADVMD|nr:metalloregulator ArsR/SmtB family transcription factor [Advenella mimigardefordensis]AHG65985.1 transcriptional regulator, ArsR family [Advenella mimigardefordensis DPN7]